MAVRGIGRLRAGGSSTDADALNWAARVVNAGGTYSGSTLQALSTFCKSAKASGYWNKINRINLFCGDQLAACLAPLKVGNGAATDTNVNFVSGDYSEATGLTGNGSSKYLNTGLTANVLTANSTSLGVYNRSTTSSASTHVRATDASSNSFGLTAPFSDNIMYSDHYNSTAGAGRVSSVAQTAGSGWGFIIGSRTASNDHKVYRNGSQLGTAATSGGSLPALAMFVFANNNNGTPSLWTAANLAGYFIGSGLSAADVTAFNTHMEAFQDALSRGVQ